MSKNIVDISGKKFARLTAYWPAGKSKDKRICWLCLCECGTFKAVTSHDLLGGNVRSCGCLRVEACSKNGKTVDRTNVIAAARKVNTTHGHTTGTGESRTYRSYRSMLNRCYRPNQHSYREYGGRGIVVCPRWLESFSNFLEDMGVRPEGKTLDRQNVNGNYEPSNCRWSSPLEQTLNRREVAAIENISNKALIAEIKRRFPQVNIDILANDF